MEKGGSPRSCLREEGLALAGVAQWIELGLRTRRSPVQFPVRVHAWVAGRVPSRGHVRGHHTSMFLSLSPSLPLSLRINKTLKKKDGSGRTSGKCKGPEAESCLVSLGMGGRPVGLERRYRLCGCSESFSCCASELGRVLTKVRQLLK